jgi:ceramide glucosyltransferase
MPVAHILALGTAAWFLISTAIFVLSFVLALLQPFLQRRRAAGLAQSPISAILPVTARDICFLDSQASIFSQNYPKFEVLIGSTETQAGGIEAFAGLAKAFPNIPCKIMFSRCESAVSPKLNTLDAPLAGASYDFILIKDSAIRLDANAMFDFMRNFAAGVGLVVGVPVAVEAKSFAGAIEACLIDEHARLLLAASSLGKGFGVGKTMLFKRSDLENAGGFGAISQSLAEDTAISRALSSLGLRTVFADKTISQVIGARTFREIAQRQFRWSVIRRREEPLTFVLEPLHSPLLASIAAAFAAPLIGLPAIFCLTLALVVFLAAEIWFLWLKGWEVPLIYPLAFLGREILSLIAWVRAFFTSEVVWAGRKLDAGTGARR